MDKPITNQNMYVWNEQKMDSLDEQAFIPGTELPLSANGVSFDSSVIKVYQDF